MHLLGFLYSAERRDTLPKADFLGYKWQKSRGRDPTWPPGKLRAPHRSCWRGLHAPPLLLGENRSPPCRLLDAFAQKDVVSQAAQHFEVSPGFFPCSVWYF